MIPVPEARKLIEQNFRKGGKETLNLKNALNRVLYNPVFAATDVPSFDNSAMDGYAFYFDDWKGLPLQVVGESAAGIAKHKKLQAGTAMRIFTGAPVPMGADTVVMQEKTEVKEGFLHISDLNLQRGMNVRKRGSQTQSGEMVMESGMLLNAGAIGFLAGLGIEKVEVFALPKVQIIVTGSEIVSPGKELQYGQIYECNSYSLVAGLGGFGIAPQVQYCADEPQLVARAVETALETADILIVTGGVSVGDYDYVVPALENANVSKIFHKLAQKPAKPLYFGVNSKTAVFGLPGNPASVLTSFYVYVQPFIRAFLGFNNPWQSLQAISSSDFHRKPGLTQFLKAKLYGNVVQILDGQESYKMNAFVSANCFIEVNEQCSEIKSGDTVAVIPMMCHD